MDIETIVSSPSLAKKVTSRCEFLDVGLLGFLGKILQGRSHNDETRISSIATSRNA